MIAISLGFLAGRYHATPWGRHVNEGAVEWPPSPWRILRALVAVWKRTLPNMPESDVKPILQRLAELPEFVLPPASTGHTRHYMPWHKKNPTLVFDTFVVLAHDTRLLALWPGASLNQEQSRILSRILCNFNVFGRSESWCEACLLEETQTEDIQRDANCVPLNGTKIDANQEIVRLLSADPETAFTDDYVVAVTKKSTIYDPAWNICMETLQLHKERWSDPPGSRWVQYLRPRNCFQIEPTRSPKPVTKHRLFQVARYAVDSNVLPLVEETLPIAERLRRITMGIHGRLTEQNGVRGRSDTLSGKDEHGIPLEGHRHAFFLSTDEDGDGRIDHITVVANMGFGSNEIKALDRIRQLKRDGSEPLNLVLMALGKRDEISAPRIFGPAQHWVSATPFIVTRHPKKRGRKRDAPELLHNPVLFVRQVLYEELERLRETRPELPDVLSVEPLEHNHIGAHKLRPIQFKRFRQKRGDDGGRRPAGAFRIVFKTPVQGPICLGHSCHFGMGLFMPVIE